jgi:hypothetical protein
MLSAPPFYYVEKGWRECAELLQIVVSILATPFLYTDYWRCVSMQAAHVGTGRNAVHELYLIKISMLWVPSISAVINVGRRVIAL